MKNLVSTARSVTRIAHGILVETHNAASSKVSNLKSQVDDLWKVATEALPYTKSAKFLHRSEWVLEKLKNRDVIGFPKCQKNP